MNEPPRFPELPYLYHRNPYTFAVVYPLDCKREALNPLGLPAVEGKPRTYYGEWAVDLGVVLVAAVWDFGAAETCRVVERVMRERNGHDIEVWWLDGVFAGQKWAEAHFPRPPEKTLWEQLLDKRPRPRKSDEDAA